MSGLSAFLPVDSTKMKQSRRRQGADNLVIFSAKCPRLKQKGSLPMPTMAIGSKEEFSPSLSLV